MTITLALCAMLLVGIVVANRVLFHDYPDSAVSTARNTLFELRRELFDVARSGAISFDHPAYGFHRTMLNAMIRYAHDVSVLQLMFSALFRNKEMRMYRAAMRKYAARMKASVPSAARSDIERIMMHADAAMLQLVCTRSIALSSLLAFAMVVAGCHRAYGYAHSTVKERMAARARRIAAHRSKVEESIDEAMSHSRSVKKVLPVIRSEAARYIPQDQFPAGMMLGAA